MLEYGMSKDRKTKIIRMFEGELQISKEPEDHEQNAIGAFIDLETTGLDSQNDEIIEIGMIVFRFNPQNGKLLQLLFEFNQLRDPDCPIPECVSKLTGITDEMVRGQRINMQELEKLLDSASIIISHNAAFDRPFLDRLTPVSTRKFWGCSMTQIPWRKEGLGTVALEYLCMDHGFFYTAHRALSDVRAALHLLSFPASSTSLPYLESLYKNAMSPTYKIQATKAPFEKKDLLKQKKFRWNAQEKVWEIETGKQDLDSLLNWLEERIYDYSSQKPTVEEISARSRFSKGRSPEPV